MITKQNNFGLRIPTESHWILETRLNKKINKNTVVKWDKNKGKTLDMHTAFVHYPLCRLGISKELERTNHVPTNSVGYKLQ